MLGARAHAILWLCLSAAPGCETRPVAADAGPSEPSPNASILPAPLATGLATTHLELAHPSPSDAGPSDAGLDAEAPPPVAAREDEPFAPDNDELRDLSGVTLRARFRFADVALPGRLPEMNTDALERARSGATFELEVTSAAAGRLRVVLASPRFVLPAGSEFRARTSIHGHVLVWPDTARYVGVQPGALRTLLNERRADVVPLAHVNGTSRAAAPALGYPNERTTLSTPLGRLELDQATVPLSGAGGALLCRFLLELAGVHPDSAACRPDSLPVRAEYSWTEGARLVFEVSALERVAQLELSSLRTPPEHAEHRIGEVPVPPSALLAERTQLRSIRLRPTVVRPAKDAPKDGLLLVNPDDLLRYALIDGWPVARLEAHGSGLLLDLAAGSYSLAARSFLGDELLPPAVVAVPGRVQLGDSPRQEP